jgi:hypothetical protein
VLYTGARARMSLAKVVTSQIQSLLLLLDIFPYLNPVEVKV